MCSIPWIIAHRGASGQYPENTIPAFLGAIELGATCVEMDIQPTSDNRLVLFHDQTMKRICGIPQKISELSYREILQFDVGQWKGPKWAGIKVPLLSDVLETLPSSINLNLELKYHSPKDDGFERAVLNIALEFDLPNRGYLAIKHIDTIPLFKKLASNCPLGLLQKQRTPQELLDLCCKWDLPIAQIRKSAATNEWVDRFHEQGIKVNYFFTDDSKEMIYLIKHLKIDGILTNYPERGVYALQTLEMSI